MYYNDINVTITSDFAVSVGLINRLVILTGEAAIDDGNNGFLKLSGSTAKKEFQTWLTTNTKTAPKALQAVINATSQTDNSGNPIIPDYIYVAGKVVSDWTQAAAVKTLTDFVESNTNYESNFWGIIATDFSALLNKWAVTYCSSKRKGFITHIIDKAYVPTDLEKSSRTYAIYNGQEAVNGVYDRSTEQWGAAIAGRVLSPTNLTSIKFKHCLGMTGYKQNELSDAQVSTLASHGINSYLSRWGSSDLDGSFTIDSDGTQKVTNHFDSMFIRDNIVYNMVKNVHAWLRQDEFAGMDDYAVLADVINAVMNEFCDLGFITTEDGVRQFKVDVPVPTSQDRKERLMNATFQFMPASSVEWVTITGKEVFDLIGGEE